MIWVILSSITASAGQEEEGKWLTYENKDLGFSIQYPPSWTAEEDKDLVQLHSNDDETIHVEITSESLPEEKTTLEEYSNMRINDLEEDNKDAESTNLTPPTNRIFYLENTEISTINQTKLGTS